MSLGGGGGLEEILPLLLDLAHADLLQDDAVARRVAGSLIQRHQRELRDLRLHTVAEAAPANTSDNHNNSSSSNNNNIKSVNGKDVTVAAAAAAKPGPAGGVAGEGATNGGGSSLALSPGALLSVRRVLDVYSIRHLLLRSPEIMVRAPRAMATFAKTIDDIIQRHRSSASAAGVGGGENEGGGGGATAVSPAAGEGREGPLGAGAEAEAAAEAARWAAERDESRADYLLQPHRIAAHIRADLAALGARIDTGTFARVLHNLGNLTLAFLIQAARVLETETAALRAGGGGGGGGDAALSQLGTKRPRAAVAEWGQGNDEQQQEEEENGSSAATAATTVSGAGPVVGALPLVLSVSRLAAAAMAHQRRRSAARRRALRQAERQLLSEGGEAGEAEPGAHKAQAPAATPSTSAEETLMPPPAEAERSFCGQVADAMDTPGRQQLPSLPSRSTATPLLSQQPQQQQQRTEEEKEKEAETQGKKTLKRRALQNMDDSAEVAIAALTSDAAAASDTQTNGDGKEESVIVVEDSLLTDSVEECDVAGGGKQSGKGKRRSRVAMAEAEAEVSSVQLVGSSVSGDNGGIIAPATTSSSASSPVLRVGGGESLHHRIVQLVRSKVASSEVDARTYVLHGDRYEPLASRGFFHLSE